MTWHCTPDDPYVLQFLDISRAHPHCLPLRNNIYTEAPRELGLSKDFCLLLQRSWYGTRDASQAFEFTVRDSFEKLEFNHGDYSVCVYRHKTKPLTCFVHGDDYVGLGERADLEQFYKDLQATFIVKHRGILGPGTNDKKQMRILNRVVTYNQGLNGEPDCITYEADQRHIDFLAADFGIKVGGKSVATPLDKANFLARHWTMREPGDTVPLVCV